MSSVLPLRRLFIGPPPPPGRVLFTEVWSRGHNNQRYVNLLPRLTRVDRLHFHVSDRRVVRGVQFRALRATARVRHRAVLSTAWRRGYRSLLVSDLEQISYFPGPVVADCDDPCFDASCVELLMRPNLRALVVVDEVVARRYREVGVRKPCYVIPHGVAASSIDPTAVAAIRRRYRRDDEIVVGYMASWLYSANDPGDHPTNNIDHLLELWDEIHAALPSARLWLLGQSSNGVRRRCERRDDILLFGRVPHDQVLSYVSNFDIALYPRTVDYGFQASKIVEYMGCGVPTVSYDYKVTVDLRASGGGLLVRTPREFVEAVTSLAADKSLRDRMGRAASAAGAARDFDVLASRYSEMLDRHL
jgi:glycosyltransferase involved in cell wall biosynthesis